MPKRFASTEIWVEDWFLDMPIEYKLFWFYLLSTCNHAGLFKVNIKVFCIQNNVKLDLNKAIDYFNNGKDRIRIVNDNLWLIEDFFFYQYGDVFNPNNRVHNSIEKLLIKDGVSLCSIRGIKEVKERVKDKVKDKDKDNSLTKKSQNQNFEENGQFKPSGNFRSQGEELFAYRFSQYDKFKQNREADS